MTEETTNPVDGEAMPEVVDAPASDTDGLESIETNQDQEPELDENGEPIPPEDELEDVEIDGKAYRLPKELKDGYLRQADYTRKTQEVSEQRKAVESRQAELQVQQQRQMEFAGEIAKLGALNARLAPYEQVQDWPTFLRQGGAEAQAHYAEFQALQNERNAFAQSLGQKVQERAAEEQRETAKQIEAGRAELAKHIKGYGPDTLSKLETFAAPFGFSPEEIRQAESDPRSIRILHLAEIGHRALQAQQKTQQLAQGQNTKPVQTLRGAAGSKSPDKMSPSEMAKHLGYR